MPSLVSAALSRVRDFLIEAPAPRDPLPAQAGVNGDKQCVGSVGQLGVGSAADSGAALHLEAVVLGLRSGSGASTLAGGLAATLAESRSVHLVAVGASGKKAVRVFGTRAGGSPWDTTGLIDPRAGADYGSVLARLGHRPAAVVWDVPPGEIAGAAEVVTRADVILAVAPGSGEPAFAEVVGGILAERFGQVVLVANAAREPARWSGRAAVCVPESRLGAVLAARGRRPAGAFGAALEEMAALVERPLAR